MKKFLATLLIVFAFFPAFASHIIGGEMLYEYVSTNANGSKKYRITLRLFKDVACENPPPGSGIPACAQMPTSVLIGIFNNDTKAQYPGSGQPFSVSFTTGGLIPVTAAPPCLVNGPTFNYVYGDFVLVVDLPTNASGYTASYQTCCRTNPLDNVQNQAGTGGTGSTYNCIIPGTDLLGTDKNNSSPKFNLALSILCQNKPFTLNFGATDADGINGDSLVYSFCEAYNGGPATSAANINPDPPLASTPPQYNSVNYINGFTATTPLGNNATINSSTGIISGIAPGTGSYVVCVCINEYRAGKLIGFHRKDFIVKVWDCDFTSAQLPVAFNECKDSTFTFANLSSLDTTQHKFTWTFGDGSSSTFSRPTHTYQDTGVFTVKLVLEKIPSCIDSATTKVYVYPGFFPNFYSVGICATKPTQFFDSTKTRYGFVNSWSWNFGDGATLADTSHQQNPSYTYPFNGTKPVTLIVGSSKGCVDTVSKSVFIMDKPPLDFKFRDTLICNGDTLQLHGIGNGSYSWTPTTNMINANTPDPLVFPKVTTVYTATLNDQGCTNQDTVRVRVVDFVTLQARGDTAICLTDSVLLTANTNGLRFEWTPAADFSNPNTKDAFATPHAALTTYQIRAHIGHCSTTDDVVVRTSPYPKADAGPDTTICFHTGAQLHGSIQGTNFSWSPASTLVNANTLTPTAFPRDTLSYVLTAFDASGSCPKPKRDTVVVRVIPRIRAFAGRDTSVVVGQPLQLGASGGVGYQWVPPTGLNNPAIFNPVGNYSGSFDSIRYTVLITNAQGCTDSASVRVRIFKTAPKIFVPTAFTPNGDGKNDVVRPIAVGIKEIQYFRIYNRWGQLVFATTTNGAGWDGMIGTKDQGTNVFVWIVKAIDYQGNTYFDKGTVTLIR